MADADAANGEPDAPEQTTPAGGRARDDDGRRGGGQHDRVAQPTGDDHAGKNWENEPSA